MKQLMIHIERAVRPIRAEESTKCKMREELHAHILEIYEEEFQKTGDEKQAINLTCLRFGSPADLSAELQHTVPWVERAITAPIEAFERRRKQETPLHHSLRVAGTLLLFIAVLGGISLVKIEFWCLPDTDADHATHSIEWAIYMRNMLAFLLFFPLNSGIFTLMGYAMRTQMETGLLKPRSFFKAGGLCLMAVAFVLFTSWGALWIITLDPLESLALLPRWSLLAGFSSIGLAVYSRFTAIQLTRSKPWTSLQINE